jgi:hypothetical protein
VITIQRIAAQNVGEPATMMSVSSFQGPGSASDRDAETVP